jgi:hypothetical protein
MTKSQNTIKPATAMPAPAPLAARGAKPIAFYVLEDWLAALVTFLISATVFFYYMCPSVTLQDSGELVTGSYRFGVPHPSGYPLWALLGWIWRHFVHIGDPASQICSFSAFTGAAVVALLTILTKRSVLVLLGSIPWREPLEPLIARILALSAGLFAGLMFAFNRGVWLWSSVPEMRILSVFMFMLTAFVFFKWLMQPERRGLLLAAVFIFGLGIANHQTTAVMLVPLMVGALFVGLQQQAASWQERMRNLWAFWEMLAAFMICWAVGILINAWLAYTPPQAQMSIYGVPEVITTWTCINAFFMQRVKALILFGPNVAVLPVLLVAIACVVVLLVWGRRQDWLRRRWVLVTTFVFMLGIAFYLYMPIAASTNPPMNWGFTSTREGFLHHITRGQYQKLSMSSPLSMDFLKQNLLFVRFLCEQFTYVFAPLALATLALFFTVWKKIAVPGRVVLMFGWISFITTSLGLIFVINPGVDAQNWGIATKFFAPAHGFFAMLIACSLALMLAWFWKSELPGRKLWLRVGGAIVGFAVLVLGIWGLLWLVNDVSVEGLGAFIAAMVLLLGLVALWYFDEQDRPLRGHALLWVSLWLLGLLASSVLFRQGSGLLPAGFVPLLILSTTLLIPAWLWSFPLARPRWTQLPTLGLLVLNAILAVATVLVSNWSSCEQRDHDFGYQFGFRMFHPGGGYPDMDKDAVLYGGTDPGRFVPTYMIFCESFAEQGSRYISKFMEPALTNKCATFDRRDVYIITQNALADGTYMNYIRDHYDFSRPNPDKPETIAKFTPWQQAIMRFAWRRMGRDVTYPKEPIFIPNPNQANDAFRQFVDDVQAGRIQPGADVRVENGRVSVEGVQGVMAINGILAKWIFDKNKDKHSFYVEESYVIPWMYPHLKPSGVIMKIEKEPLPTPQQDANYWQQLIAKDFTYWDHLLGEFLKRPEFKRDSDAQKAFSKLRCAIAGIYEFRGIVNAAEAAYVQAIAICPESPEASFRLANLYMRLNRVDKAVETLGKLAERDPFNKQVREALDQFQSIQRAMQPGAQQPAQPAPFPMIRGR